MKQANDVSMSLGELGILKWLALQVLFVSMATVLEAAESPNPLLSSRIDAAFGVHQLQQRVQAEGGDNALHVVDHYLLSLNLSGSFHFSPYMALGMFLHLDEGLRTQTSLHSLDSRKNPVSGTQSGGAYTEFWLGPLIQVFWDPLQAEFGYAAIGWLDDNTRGDLKTTGGSSSGSLSMRLGSGWLLSLGANFPLYDIYRLVAKLEYRTRIYDARAGKALANGTEMPMQSIMPYLGVAFGF